LFDALKFGFILLGMNAVYRANVHAGGILGANAGFGNDVGHMRLLLGEELNLREIKTAIQR
jgi:hypothetical protein